MSPNLKRLLPLIISLLIAGILIYLASKKSHNMQEASPSEVNQSAEQLTDNIDTVIDKLAPAQEHKTSDDIALSINASEQFGVIPDMTGRPILTMSLFNPNRGASVTPEKIEAYLNQGGDPVVPLLMKSDQESIKLALDMYGDDPRVILKALDNREWIESPEELIAKLEQQDPGNQVTSIYAAVLAIEEDDDAAFEQAMREAIAREGKFEDYRTESMLGEKEYFETTGTTETDSLFQITFGLTIPVAYEQRNIATHASELARSAAEAGDMERAAQLLIDSMTLSETIGNKEEHFSVIEALVRAGNMKQASSTWYELGLDGLYPEAGISPPPEETPEHINELIDLTVFAMVQPFESHKEFKDYLNRIMIQGEHSANLWLAKRHPEEAAEFLAERKRQRSEDKQ